MSVEKGKGRKEERVMRSQQPCQIQKSLSYGINLIWYKPHFQREIKEAHRDQDPAQRHTAESQSLEVARPWALLTTSEEGNR